MLAIKRFSAFHVELTPVDQGLESDHLLHGRFHGFDCVLLGGIAVDGQFVLILGPRMTRHDYLVVGQYLDRQHPFEGVRGCEVNQGDDDCLDIVVQFRA